MGLRGGLLKKDVNNLLMDLPYEKHKTLAFKNSIRINQVFRYANSIVLKESKPVYISISCNLPSIPHFHASIAVLLPEKKNESRKRKAIASKTKNQLLDKNEEDSDSETKEIKRRKKKICIPRALLSVIQGFNEVQKDCVRQMGFGGILKMKMTEIVLQRGMIDVTKESFSKLPFRTIEDKCYEEWTNQFKDKKMIRLQDIKMKIVSTNKADMNFRMNFLALLINSLIESISLGIAKTNPFNHITSKMKINNILLLLYVGRIKSDVLKVERTRPVICHWTLENIKMRETFQKDEVGDFGAGDFNDEFVEEELNKEAYEEMVMIKYRKLAMLIEDGINKFPENVTLNYLQISFDENFEVQNEDNQEKSGTDDVQDDNIDDDEDENGVDNGEAKKKNVWEKKMRMLKEERNSKEKMKMKEVKILKEQVNGKEDETDNNDQGLDDVNLHDEGVENDKGGNNEEDQNDNEKEQNAEGRGKQLYRLINVEGKNIEGKNAKKGDGRTGVEGKSLEGKIGDTKEGKLNNKHKMLKEEN
uniref:Uncharacterized protein n=1 Tax=Lactuca sativa TaxID=4236 RepID=A0A9R1UR34_LACSA|nr:hypothetical protein LSAT_V11C800425040 [Lactuca sativa]